VGSRCVPQRSRPRKPSPKKMPSITTMCCMTGIGAASIELTRLVVVKLRPVSTCLSRLRKAMKPDTTNEKSAIPRRTSISSNPLCFQLHQARSANTVGTNSSPAYLAATASTSRGPTARSVWAEAALLARKESITARASKHKQKASYFFNLGNAPIATVADNFACSCTRTSLRIQRPFSM